MKLQSKVALYRQIWFVMVLFPTFCMGYQPGSSPYRYRSTSSYSSPTPPPARVVVGTFTGGTIAA